MSICVALVTGICPWQREVGIPRNFNTGKPYNGINVLLLGLRQQKRNGDTKRKR